MRLEGTLLGFADFEVIGAAKGKAPASKKAAPTPTGPGKPGKVKPYPKPNRTHAIEHHGKVLHGAHAVATKAAHVLARAQQLLTAKPQPVATAHPTLPSLIQHGKPVHLGAAAAALTPKQRLAVQKHNDAVAKQLKATKNLVQHAAKAHASASMLAKKMVTQRKIAKGLRTPKKRVHVGDMLSDPMIGDQVSEVLQQYYDEIGAAPDPENPGFLDDGSPDPAAQSVSTPTPGAGTPTADASLDDDSGALSPTETDPTTLPPPQDMSTPILDMKAVGGIAYNGEKGTPDGYCLSFGLATRKTDWNVTVDTARIDGTEHYGYVFGRYDLLDPPNGGIRWGSNLAPNAWNHVHGRYVLDDQSWHEAVDPSEAFGSSSKSSPQGKSYGPLIGNPVIKDFVGLRVDAQGHMFWLPQEAPDWLMFPIKQAAAITAQAAQKANADAAAAEAAVAAKATADAAAAQSAQEAQNALTESQAASTAKVAKGEAETQAAQALVQQQQAEAAQQTAAAEQEKQAGALLIQQAQQQQEQEQKVQSMLLQQAQREQDYLTQHPEEEFAPEAADGGGMEEERGTEDDGGLDQPAGDEGTSGDDDWDDSRGADTDEG